MSLNIEENAIFIADSHFNENQPELLIFLEKLQLNEIKTTQLFLLGDMFDFISGECSYFIKQNQEIIDLLNDLSQKIDIIYLEGNHDYNLKKLFPSIKVFSRDEQPVSAKYADKRVALCHGDMFVNSSYELYCKVIRNRVFLKFMNLIDFNNWISKKIYFGLLSKNICRIIPNFEDIVKKRVENYSEDIVIEGHYHQGKQYEIDNKRYINIPSLACSKEYSCINSYVISNNSL